MQVQPSERSRPHLKPRFPRLELLLRRRKDDEQFNDLGDPRGRRPKWYCTADQDGLVQIRIH